ncbi:MAG: DUF488 family protein, partial [Euryarchaeota archaeon]|nr:DUF488 family protein [Euryarchaeota archaeon]MBV1767676.1 DUF488 family protein [Methanobacterium sp.]
MIKIKQVTQLAEKGEGFRILVDRTWPPQLPKESIKIDCGYEDLAPNEGPDI